LKVSPTRRFVSSPTINHSYLNSPGARSVLAWLICLAVTSGVMCPSISAKVRKQPVKPKVVKPVVTSVQSMEGKGDADSRIVSIEIGGTGFGKSAADHKITLVDIISGDEIEATVTVADTGLIIARAEIPHGEGESSQWLVKLEIKGQSVDTGRSRVKLAATKVAAPKVRNIDVDHTSYNSPADATSHSLLLTPTDDNEQFSTDPSKMSVQILPPGATKITIEPAISPKKMLVTFNAPQDFEVKELFVTSSDGSTSRAADADREKPAKPAKQLAQAIKIDRVDVLSLQRRDGFGRIRILGEGFGQHAPAPYNGDLELLCDPEYRTYHAAERVDTHKKLNNKKKNAASDDQDKDDNEVPQLATLCANLKQKLAGTAAGITTDENSRFMDIKNWRRQIEQSVNVALVPRNPDFRVERTVVLYVDDKVIDVYFEFSHWDGVSQPFRLDGVSVSVTKETARPADKTDTTAHHGDTPATPIIRKATYLASHDIGPPRDTNLEYRYTVMDKKDAAHLFGSGVSENFYVIQLSLVNKGGKKVIVPLSSIQAEIEWSYGEDKENTFYDEGPATVSPMTLSAISSYFDLFQKTKGKKARLFNVLDGVLTLGASLVPVFGRNIERPIAIMSGGFIPGLRKSLGDLSSQQLQNLTSLSWESVEEIPANGGKEKFVYIQRSDQSFSKDPKIIKEIKSIAGIEVSGFIVKDSSTAAAVREQ
jgi:hypothetical protein